MTLEDVKQIDFSKEMSEVRIAEIVDDMLQISDKREFGLILLYLLDDFITIDGSHDNLSVKQILQTPSIKQKYQENFKDDKELSDLGQ